jgi:hypothetical protein
MLLHLGSFISVSQGAKISKLITHVKPSLWLSENVMQMLQLALKNSGASLK